MFPASDKLSNVSAAILVKILRGKVSIHWDCNGSFGGVLPWLHFRELNTNASNYYECTQKTSMHFLSNWMGSDRGDSFPFDYENKWNSIWFKKSKGKLYPRSFPIQFERKWNPSFINVKRYYIIRNFHCNCTATVDANHFKCFVVWMGIFE